MIIFNHCLVPGPELCQDVPGLYSTVVMMIDLHSFEFPSPVTVVQYSMHNWQIICSSSCVGRGAGQDYSQSFRRTENEHELTCTVLTAQRAYIFNCRLGEVSIV